MGRVDGNDVGIAYEVTGQGGRWCCCTASRLRQHVAAFVADWVAGTFAELAAERREHAGVTTRHVRTTYRRGERGSNLRLRRGSG